MSSGSASKLVNGENKKENVDGHGYGNRKENERGAAGSTASSIVVLAGDTSNATSDATTIVAVAATGTTASGTASNAGTGGGSDNNNGGNGCSASGSGNGDSDSNSGACVTGLTAGGVVGSVEFRDVNSDPRTPEDREEDREEDHEEIDEDEHENVDGAESSETEFQDSYPGACVESVETPILDFATTTSTVATTTIATSVPANVHASVIEHDERTTALSVACYEEDEEEDREEEDDDNMVAAMNEHLSTTSATSGVRSSTVSTTTASNSVVNQNNSCSRNEFQSVDEDGKPAAGGILSFPCDFDHMYASMTDGGAPAAATATSALGVSPLRGNEPRQNDLTEVKHLKELLLLHLDLIQQQSEQIVTKDKLLAALRQENETVLYLLFSLFSYHLTLSTPSRSVSLRLTPSCPVFSVFAPIHSYFNATLRNCFAKCPFQNTRAYARVHTSVSRLSLLYRCYAFPGLVSSLYHWPLAREGQPKRRHQTALFHLAAHLRNKEHVTRSA